MKDRRLHKRVMIKGVHGNMFFSAHADITDISLGGMAIKLNKGLILGREYTIKLENKGKTIEFKGTPVWSVLAVSEKGMGEEIIPVYDAGVRFSGLLTERTEELIKFIESLRHKSAEDRLRGLRFRIHTPENSVLLYPSGYSVKMISASGMLVETRQPFSLEARFPMEIVLKEDTSVRFLGRIASCTEIK